MKSAAAKIVLKLLNFKQKQRRMVIAQGMLKTVQQRYRFVHKGHNCWRIMDVWLWHWNQGPIIPMEVSRKAKTEISTSSSIKCKGFAHCFHRLQWCGTSWILATRNTTLKLSADCAKQFFRNSQNCGKPKHGFCTITTEQLTHRCLCVSFWPKTKP